MELVYSIYMITLTVAVYHLWLERNSRIFQQKKQLQDALLRRITQETYYRASLFSRLAAYLNRLDWYLR
ncbi:hypothetical protein RND71_001555 [Anisodus tanguticus]|uniref:Uncharacterized protein n=1 Tax=Anisodus tanguticus TaxID=243964 RepID=A0AAE1SY82_9SOLA|nr:hypothetical protein RND71_001555 [Anisodus tanguticus]